MYNLEQADEIFNEMSTDEKVNKLFDIFRDTMPEEYCRLMYIMKYGCHIVTAEFYNEAVSLLKWIDNKGTGARWTIEDVEKVASDIDFDDKEYYLYDFAYIMNMLYSDYCNVFTDAGYYLRMTKNYLEDPDYMGNPSERAYCDAMERVKYHKEGA